MKPLKKQVLTTTTLILILTFATFMAITPNAKAADVPTWAYVAVSPNPVGVNQEVIVMMWLNLPPPTAAGPYGDRWQGYMLTITTPDGTTETKGPYTSDPVSGAYYQFTPTMVGTYSFQFSFPGQHIAGDASGGLGPPAMIDNQYQASTSQKIELVVQQNPVQGYQPAPLPSGYWSRPIYAENREWASIAGNWLMSAYDVPTRAFDGGCAVAPNKAPNTAHIMWTRSITFGGTIGTGYGADNYYNGLSYEMMFKPPIIINGRLYYNTALPPRYGWVCVDLQTGQELWWHNSSGNPVPDVIFGGMNYLQLGFGQILDYNSPNQHGGIAYLWSAPVSVLGVSTGTWSMYDAFTGNWILDIANVPQGAVTFGPSGELLVYVLDPVTNTLVMWNSTRCISPPGGSGTQAWTWRPPLGATLDPAQGIQWNVTIPPLIPSQSVFQVTDVIYASNALGLFGPPDTFAGYDKNTGAHLWTATLQRPANLPSVAAAQNIADGIYTEYVKETKQWYGYDVKTGKLLWGPTDPYTSDWAMYNAYEGKVETNGLLIAAGWDGYVHAHDLTTGEIKWEYFSGTTADTELPYGTYPFYGGILVTDGKVFATPGEHSPSAPMPRGEKLHVINIDNGKAVWTLTGWFQHPVAADGYMLSLNGYDNQIYCFGKGPSATTVQAPLAGIPKGSSITIMGTVTDQSSGQKGTPCVSDGDQSAWMEYLHMQKPMPMATGVQVQLTAFAADGSYTEIGAVTSDGSGMFKKSWTPTTEGEYTIVASFGGTQSYGSSSAETAVTVTPATATTTQTTTNAPLDIYIIVATIVILIAIVIVAVVLRKK